MRRCGIECRRSRLPHSLLCLLDVPFATPFRTATLGILRDALTRVIGEENFFIHPVETFFPKRTSVSIAHTKKPVVMLQIAAIHHLAVSEILVPSGSPLVRPQRRSSFPFREHQHVRHNQCRIYTAVHAREVHGLSISVDVGEWTNQSVPERLVLIDTNCSTFSIVEERHSSCSRNTFR